MLGGVGAGLGTWLGEAAGNGVGVGVLGGVGAALGAGLGAGTGVTVGTGVLGDGVGRLGAGLAVGTAGGAAGGGALLPVNTSAVSRVKPKGARVGPGVGVGARPADWLRARAGQQTAANTRASPAAAAFHAAPSEPARWTGPRDSPPDGRAADDMLTPGKSVRTAAYSKGNSRWL